MTTTVAGGYSKKAGHMDGPAQNATFSEDFDLLYMHKMCALLIIDRGSRMIRNMDLKPEDCTEKPQSSKGLGAIPVSIIAVITLFCGSVIGFIAHPFITSGSSEASMSHFILHSWKHIQKTWRKPVPIVFSGIKSVVASSKAINLLLFRFIRFAFYYICAVFRHFGLEIRVHGRDPGLSRGTVFIGSNHVLKLRKFADETKDLIDFEEESSSLDSSSSIHQQVQREEALGRCLDEEEDEVDLEGKIDSLMIANLLDFATPSKQQSLAKRRQNRVHGGGIIRCEDLTYRQQIGS